jgi:hypothetical protein
MDAMKTYKIAVLDDYQNAALESADWSVLGQRADITVFKDHLADPEAVIERLLPFDVICVMRERSPLPRNIIEGLPMAHPGGWSRWPESSSRPRSKATKSSTPPTALRPPPEPTRATIPPPPPTTPLGAPVRQQAGFVSDPRNLCGA